MYKNWDQVDDVTEISCCVSRTHALVEASDFSSAPREHVCEGAKLTQFCRQRESVSQSSDTDSSAAISRSSTFRPREDRAVSRKGSYMQ